MRMMLDDKGKVVVTDLLGQEEEPVPQLDEREDPREPTLHHPESSFVFQAGDQVMGKFEWFESVEEPDMLVVLKYVGQGERKFGERRAISFRDMELLGRGFWEYLGDEFGRDGFMNAEQLATFAEMLHKSLRYRYVKPGYVEMRDFGG